MLNPLYQMEVLLTVPNSCTIISRVLIVIRETTFVFEELGVDGWADKTLTWRKKDVRVQCWADH